MDPETSERKPAAKSRHRANPLAISGVLLIVLLSIFLGIFGPQISDYRRGQYVSGQPVVDLLRGISSVHFQESRKVKSRFNRSGPVFDPLDQEELERSIVARFGAFDPPIFLQPSGFGAAAFNDAVDLTPFRKRVTSRSRVSRSSISLPGRVPTQRMGSSCSFRS